MGVPPRLHLARRAHQAGERRAGTRSGRCRVMPAMPTISPPCAVKSDIVEAARRRSFVDGELARSASLTPAPFAREHAASTVLPTISRSISSSDISAIGAEPRTSPSRMTVTRSAICADFLQAVRDVDDGGAARGGGAHLLEQELDEIRGQRRRRLVEDQDLRFDRQRLGELDELTLGDADLGHARPRVHRAADALELLGDPVHAALLRRWRRSAERPAAGSRRR